MFTERLVDESQVLTERVVGINEGEAAGTRSDDRCRPVVDLFARHKSLGTGTNALSTAAERGAPRVEIGAFNIGSVQRCKLSVQDRVVGRQNGLERFRRHQSIVVRQGFVSTGRRQVDLELSFIVVGMRHRDKVAVSKFNGPANSCQTVARDRRDVGEIHRGHLQRAVSVHHN